MVLLQGLGRLAQCGDLLASNLEQFELQFVPCPHQCPFAFLHKVLTFNIARKASFQRFLSKTSHTTLHVVGWLIRRGPDAAKIDEC